jgi:tRNA threonylcarbamoyladenosine biosynthesis protein TsaB
VNEGTTIGFDTATSLLSVAAVRDGETVHESTVAPDEGGRPRHARALLGEIELAADAAGGWARVGLLAVGIGPGTFTGLRIGISTARALAQGRGLPLAGVGSLTALAEPATALERPLLAVIDARRGEAFAQLWRADRSVAWGPVVEGPDLLAERVRAEGSKPLAFGDGSLRFRDQLERSGAEVPGPDERVHRVSAAAVCRLAALGESGAAEAIEPDYLRRPDAELWREQQRRERAARDFERDDRDR